MFSKNSSERNRINLIKNKPNFPHRLTNVCKSISNSDLSFACHVSCINLHTSVFMYQACMHLCIKGSFFSFLPMFITRLVKYEVCGYAIDSQYKFNKARVDWPAVRQRSHFKWFYVIFLISFSESSGSYSKRIAISDLRGQSTIFAHLFTSLSFPVFFFFSVFILRFFLFQFSDSWYTAIEIDHWIPASNGCYEGTPAHSFPFPIFFNLVQGITTRSTVAHRKSPSGFKEN